jgi:hypothetical protein
MNLQQSVAEGKRETVAGNGQVSAALSNFPLMRVGMQRHYLPPDSSLLILEPSVRSLIW